MRWAKNQEGPDDQLYLPNCTARDKKCSHKSDCKLPVKRKSERGIAGEVCTLHSLTLVIIKNDKKPEHPEELWQPKISKQHHPKL